MQKRREIMRKTFAMTALAALVAAPLLVGATEASATCQDRKTTGTLLGGVGGALVGNSISHGGGGAVIGGLGGAVLGHEIARSGGGCATTRTYYRTSRTRYASERAPAAPPRAVRKVYYDEYGNPVASSPVYR
jgi:uncharacterized protein YcfJ